MEENTEDRNFDVITTLMTVPSIGELTARFLAKKGYSSLNKIKKAGWEEISNLKEIGPTKAKKIVDELEGKSEDSYNIFSEFMCPNCSAIVSLSHNKCYECGTRFSDLEEQVFLPGGIILDNPLETLAEYEVKIADGDDNEEIWYGRAAILESIGAYQSAYESYDKVIEFDPLFDRIWNAKARLAMKLGKTDEAARAYKIAVDSRVGSGLAFESMLGTEEPSSSQPSKKEHKIGVREVEEKISLARSEVSNLAGNAVNIEHLRKLLGEASKARIQDDRETAVEVAQEVLEKASLLTKVSPLIKDIERGLSSVDNDDIGEEYYNRFQTISMNIKEGEYDDLYDNAEGLRDDIERYISAGELVETVEEEVTTPEEVSEEVIYQEIFEETLSRARSNLAEARDTKINIDRIKSSLRDALKARKEGSLKDAHEAVECVFRDTEKVFQIFEMLTEGKKIIVEMKNSNLEFKTYLEKLKKIKELADQGDYQESLNLAEEEISNMQNILGSQDEEENKIEELIVELNNKCDMIPEDSVGKPHIKKMINEARELQREGKLNSALEKLNMISTLFDSQTKFRTIYNEFIDRIERTGEESNEELTAGLERARALASLGKFNDGIEVLESIKTPTPLDEEKENLSEEIAELKKYIVIARNNDLDVEKAGEKINKAMISANNESYEEAFTFLDEGIQLIKSSMDDRLSQLIGNLENILEEADDVDAKEEARKYIAKARELWGDNHYATAFKRVSEATRLSEDAKTPDAKAKDKIDAVEQLIKDSQAIGVNVEEAYDLLFQAKDKIEQGTPEEAMDIASKAKDSVMNNMPYKLKNVMKQAQEELRDAKLSGKNVSKSIYLLKQVNLNGELKDLEESIRYLKKYKEEMQKMAE